MSDEDPYLYPGSSVLRNKLGITDAKQLDYAERELVVQRSRQGIPRGGFDLAHLRAIHRHLFQDVYEWAGELRTVELTKGGHRFQFRRYIETGMADVHRRLVKAQLLHGLSHTDFAEAAGQIIGDVNYVHPFREGNGRTQLHYLKQLTEQAGHALDLTRLDAERWIAASRAAHHGNYEPMIKEIDHGVTERSR
ncbi:MAG TPA: Fic family protein [Stellaceae bacterium]|nr:Fic family protein [Stellaceae bacterium]